MKWQSHEGRKGYKSVQLRTGWGSLFYSLEGKYFMDGHDT